MLPEVRAEWRPYIKFYKMEPRIKICSIEENIEEMEKAGVTKAVLVSPTTEHHKYIYELTKKYSGRFYGFAAVSPSENIMKAYYELEKCYEEYGFVGFSVASFMTGVPASDPCFYPLYALSEKHGKAAVLNSAMHYNPNVTIDVCHPRHCDLVGTKFQGLNILMSHAGSGFGLSPNAIAQRLPNVYMEYSALLPFHQRPETLVAMNSFLKKKTIFATDYPALPWNTAEAWKKVIKPENQEDFFYNNAARVLGLDK